MGLAKNMAGLLVLLILGGQMVVGQQAGKEVPFKWVNAFPKDRFPGLHHANFQSPSNNTEIGYCIYLPPGYNDVGNKDRRYPVVYWLHGGRPGSETRAIALTSHLDREMKKGTIPPMIYVFPNGGIVSHYDYPKLKSLGETAFIKELIPHIDRTYRTIAAREGRGIEGFSQGGRGTARNMLKYPELFISAAPMGGGHQHEKRISENNGDEGQYQFEPENNTYHLARKYAVDRKPPLRILVVVGDKDMNYQANLDWMEHLRSLKIPFEQRIIEGVPHSIQGVYEKAGLEIMKFHAENFKKSADNSGLQVHEVESPYQAGKTMVRVLLPDRLEKGKRYPVVYVLPVEAGRESRYGDGLVEVKKHDLHNRHAAIFVAPTFSHLPWYADHPTRNDIQQETYLLKVVLPLVEKNYPVQVDPAGRLLLGFSKSGWGAYSLLLRHPTIFGKAVAWDAPLMMDRPGKYGSGEIFGTAENFAGYQISKLLGKAPEGFQKDRRLILLGYGNFRADHQATHGLMTDWKIMHEYRDGPSRKHDWHSGWVAEAVEILLPTEDGKSP